MERNGLLAVCVLKNTQDVFLPVCAASGKSEVQPWSSWREIEV
jgi:hypothetical protein